MKASMHLRTPETVAPPTEVASLAYDRRQSPFSRRITHLGEYLSAGADWIEQHWIALLASLITGIVLLALLDPLLYALGFSTVGATIFRTYHYICAQIPSHSYYLLGYQLALCARNLAIYASLAGGTWLYWWLRRQAIVILPLDWRLWLLTMVPMALDGGTQLFGWRESTWELRTLTGLIFGLGACWFLLPRLDQALNPAPLRPVPSPLYTPARAPAAFGGAPAAQGADGQ